MTKDDFLAWKSSTVTKEVFRAILLRREEVKELCIRSAGRDPNYDSRLSGMAEAFNTILDIDFEEFEE